MSQPDRPICAVVRRYAGISGDSGTFERKVPGAEADFQLRRFPPLDGIRTFPIAGREPPSEASGIIDLMDEILSPNQLKAHAQARLAANGRVGAAFDHDRTEADRDEARRWRFFLIDAQGNAAHVDFVSTRIPREWPMLVEPLEDAVEQLVEYTYESDVSSVIAESQRLRGPLIYPRKNGVGILESGSLGCVV